MFAWLLTGLPLEKSSRLSGLATGMVSGAKAASRVCRRRCFLAKAHVVGRDYSDGLIRLALAGGARQTIDVAIDTTSVAGRVVIGRVAVVYRGRAVPLV
ncbi:MAG TPA: hypothetical protein DEP84_27100 [Chloroflexi bacterium]|nr:hypothetical protein [Chloroflexota bacterium]